MADQPSAPPPSMFGAPFKPAAPPQLPVAQPSQFPELPPAPAVDSAAGTATPAPPPRVWLSGTRGNMPVVPPVPTAFYGAGQAPSTARPDLGATSIANGQPSGAQEFDRRWVALEDEQGAAHARTPVQQSEAEMGEMRMQVLMNENMALRSALRMDQKMPVEALKKQTSSNGTPEALRETRDVITPQNEMNRLQKELDQTASKLSKAESNVDRKAEMIQILRAQLDEADKKLSQGRPDNEERMRMQEDLMQSRAQIRALQQDLDKERKLKEDAWERLLKVDPEKLESLQAQLEEEKLNCAEMLEEIRGLRAEKDAAAREAAILISSLTAERNALMDEVQQARSGRDMQLNSLQDERGDAIEKLQSLREDYANLDSQVSQSKIDNQALMAQLKFLTQQLQAKQVLPDTGDQIASISNNQTQLATKGFSWPTLTPGEQVNGDGFRDADEQARFYEQQILMQQQSPMSKMPQPTQQQQQHQNLAQMTPTQLYSPDTHTPRSGTAMAQMQANMQPRLVFGSTQPQKQATPQQINIPGPSSVQLQQQPSTPGTPQMEPGTSMTPQECAAFGLPPGSRWGPSSKGHSPPPQRMVPTPQPGTPSQMNRQAVPQMNQQGTPQMNQQVPQQMLPPQHIWAPMQMTPVSAPPPQSVALMEQTADQVLQAGFDPNYVIGV